MRLMKTRDTQAHRARTGKYLNTALLGNTALDPGPSSPQRLVHLFRLRGTRVGRGDIGAGYHLVIRSLHGAPILSGYHLVAGVMQPLHHSSGSTPYTASRDTSQGTSLSAVGGLPEIRYNFRLLCRKTLQSAAVKRKTLRSR